MALYIIDLICPIRIIV